ncbi:MAG: dihydrofolate reductase [Planctomycetes bacterium]|nr:dihydrofolate reductase [Planctomycetota bacterium]
MREFEIVVATDDEGGIGRDGDLPWRLPADLAYFRELTTGDGGNTVIMGRHTWESIPERYRPLPGRRNVVLSRLGVHPLPEGVLQATGLEEAVALAGAGGQVCVIGGGAVYREAVLRPECSRVHLTRIAGRFGCDTFFPAIEAVEEEWVEEFRSGSRAGHGVHYEFLRYRRR